MDNGEVIPGLNEGWTLMGAKISDWISGVISAMFFGTVTGLNASLGMPLYLAIIVGVSISMASLRKKFPDEERGIANMLATKLGFAPPNIPRPAELQPIWSGAPIAKLAESKDYSYLDLDEMFELIQEEKLNE